MLPTILRRTVGPMILLLPILSYADGASAVREQCAGCHALERPDFETLGVSERLQRKAPPLYYAGNKYRAEWLEAWLQWPETIHPAGYFPQVAVKSTSQGDSLDDEALHKHLKLDAAKAKETTKYLMTLRPHDGLIAGDGYTPGSISPRMGQMNFRKFKGCDGCHQDEKGEGGLSGPVLYNAWERLQPAFISSYVQNPEAWDPNSIMPVPQMNEDAVHKLVNYLKVIGGEQ